MQEEQKETVKNKIIHRLEEKDLEVIPAEKNPGIVWEEEGSEFSLNGEMYDVVKTTVVNGKKLLFCINDKKEKALVDQYNLATKGNSSSDRKSRNIDTPFNLFVNIVEDDLQHFTVFQPNLYSSFDSRLPRNVMDQVSPPPKA